MKKTVNPFKAERVSESMAETLRSIRRIDENGILYEMDYTANYYDPLIVREAEKISKELKSGCSAFSVYNEHSEYLLCRNYDCLHKDLNGKYTGLNVLIHTAPEGKLKSVCICDAFWLNPAAYYAGALDDGKTDISAMAFAPYRCIDGMNEAGLCASFSGVDLKPGETNTNQNTGKTRMTHSMLLRAIIDNARSIDEAVEIAENTDVYSIGGSDLHIYISSKDGSSAVLEWRQYGTDPKQKLYVTYTNAVTNFFVGFDDGQDSYKKDGSLREIYSGISYTVNHYRYGYGHGYHRFNQIISALERYILTETNRYGIRNSMMEEKQALDVLRVCTQNPEMEHASRTQYSAVYNPDKLSLRLWMQRDYGHMYEFEV